MVLRFKLKSIQFHRVVDLNPKRENYISMFSFRHYLWDQVKFFKRGAEKCGIQGGLSDA